MSKSESKILREIKRGVYNSSVDDVQVLKKLESDGFIIPPLSKMGKYRLTDNGKKRTNVFRKIVVNLIKAIKLIKS